MDKCILVVEDDAALGRVLRDTLGFEGYMVDVAGSLRVAREKLVQQSPDLALLDLMLPDGDGFELCATLRREQRAAVIVLTARSQKADKLNGLALGADDYITKPFDLEELLARIRTVLRRIPHDDGRLALGTVIVNFQTRRATRGGREFHLTHQEFAVLHYLADRTGQVVSRDELLKNVWSYADSPITRSVDHAIARLRKKLERDPHHPRFIHSIHGSGYCLTPDGSEMPGGA